MQVKNNLQLYDCGSVLNQNLYLSFSVTLNRFIGFLIQFFPNLITSRLIQNKGVNMKGYTDKLLVIPASKPKILCITQKAKTVINDCGVANLFRL
jgi:hypothetical protein